VETVGFDYGQRHRIELACRDDIRRDIAAIDPSWGAKLGDDHLLQLPVLGSISDTALTTETKIALSSTGLPTTFVPGRNILFLTLAAALAFRRGVRHIVCGVCETDFSGYPDCRDDTIKALQITLNLGMEQRFVLHTPLMWIDKAATWRMAEGLGGLQLIRLIQQSTHTCYLGDRQHLHEWGYGCGRCPACELRSKGWTAYRAAP
jgi:7-cyano-7-deazaguanine synthase